MSKHFQKFWGPRHVYALGCFALVLASGAMADNTLPDSTMVYQLSDLDQASAASVQIVSSSSFPSTLLKSMPTPAVELATSSAASAEDASALELVAKTTLSPGITIDGLACNILHTPTGKHRWSILQYDLSIDTANQKAVFVADEERVIQSVACSADGSQVLMAIQDSVGGDSEVYLIDQTSHETQRLTDNETEDLDVSMSQDGRIISWQGRLADDREAVFVRTIAEDGSYTDVALSSKFPFTQPSLSDNGEWLVLINERNRYDYIMRYQVSTGEFTTVKLINSNRYEVADPSISNDGTKVLWSQDYWYRTQDLILADLEAGTSTTILRKYFPAELSHPYLSGDGGAILYGVNNTLRRQTFLRVLRTGAIYRLGKVLWPENRYSGSQLRAVLDIETFHLASSAVNGAIIISPAVQDGFIAGESVTLNASADAGYVFESWGGDSGICLGERSTCTFVMPAKNIEVVANFREWSEAEGLVAYYPFNGNANDESGNLSDGVVTGAELTTDRNNIADSAYSFNGRSRIVIPDSESMHFTDQLSFSAWVNLKNSYANQKIFSKFKYPYATDSGFIFGLRDKKIYYEVMTEDRTFNVLYGTCGQDIESNSWVHLVGTWRLGGQFAGYVNGALSCSKDAQKTHNLGNTTNPAVIGAFTASGGFSVNGSIDDVRLYNRELSAAEIQNLYNGGQ